MFPTCKQVSVRARDGQVPHKSISLALLLLLVPYVVVKGSILNKHKVALRNLEQKISRVSNLIRRPKWYKLLIRILQVRVISINKYQHAIGRLSFWKIGNPSKLELPQFTMTKRNNYRRIGILTKPSMFNLWLFRAVIDNPMNDGVPLAFIVKPSKPLIDCPLNISTIVNNSPFVDHNNF